jgi:hypothetical protein
MSPDPLNSSVKLYHSGCDRSRTEAVQPQENAVQATFAIQASIVVAALFGSAVSPVGAVHPARNAAAISIIFGMRCSRTRRSRSRQTSCWKVEYSVRH